MVMQRLKSIIAIIFSQTQGLRFKFYLALVVTLTAVLTLFCVLNFNNYKVTLNDQLADEIKATANRLSKSIAEPLWNADEAQVVSLLKSEVLSKNIAGAIVKLPNESEYGFYKKQGQVEVIPKEMIMAEEAAESVIRYREAGKDYNLGRLFIYINEKAVIDKLNHYLLTNVFQIIALNVILVLCIAFLLNRIIISPLEKIKQAISTISAGEGDLSMRVSVKEFSPEIAELGNDFNRFAYKLMLRT